MERTAYLIDGSAYIYRAYHALAPLSNSAGLPTNAVYGFTQTLRRIRREKNPQLLAVAFDSRGEVFRHQLYPQYKAHRPPMPDDLAVQIPYIKRMVAAYNIPFLEEQGQEADDLIAASVSVLADQGYQVVIVSGDKDLLQLVAPAVCMWDPMRDVIMDQDGVQARYGLGPEFLLDYFSLTGDTADNIPGVAGIGPKTAQKLISQYGSLEALFASLDGMKKSSMKENLIRHRDDAFLSRELVRLNRAVQVPTDPAAYRPGSPDREALRILLTELEFRKLLREEVPAEKMDDGAFVLIRDEQSLQSLLSMLTTEAPYLALDAETTSLDPLRAELVGLSLAMDRERAWYLPCGHRGADGTLLACQLARESLIKALRPLLENERLPKIGHNLKYDYAVLAALHNGGLSMRGPLYDTMLGAWLLAPDRHSYGLDDLARELGLEMTSFAEVVGGSPEEAAFSRVSLEAACSYSCEDVQASLALFHVQKPRLEKEGMWPLFAELEGPLVPVLAAMEREGMAVDRQALAHLSQAFGSQLEVLEKEIHGMAGGPFNINSPAQLGKVLFEDLDLPRGRKTKTGYSTDVEVLEKLATRHPLPALIVRYRNLAKLKSTYVDRLAGLIHPLTRRVHSSFNQCGTATGRLSSSNPNLQNIPVRGEEGKLIRACFVPRAGYLFLAADYSQIDLRVLAHYARDPALLEAFQQNEDIHRRTAGEIFFVAPELVTPEMRRVAKTINFGIVYGMSSFGLATQLQISRKEAQLFIDRYFAHYRGVKEFMEAIVLQAKKDGFVTTLLGRRRPLPEITSSNRIRREFAERAAINTPIQGTAADIIKLAMLRVHRELTGQELESRLVLQVHDELVLEVPQQELEHVSIMLRQCMEQGIDLAVPLVVNLTTGQNLSKA